MKSRLPALLFFVAAGMFLSVGWRSSPTNSTWIVLGIVFFILGTVTYRRSRTLDK